jgi:tetratricopeptide (TPR) repeat protein
MRGITRLKILGPLLLIAGAASAIPFLAAPRLGSYLEDTAARRRLEARRRPEAPGDPMNRLLVRREWEAAIALCEQSYQQARARQPRLDRSDWAVAIGELCVCDLRPAAAIPEFESALDRLPKTSAGRQFSYSRWRAAMGLARAHAALHEFDTALEWLEASRAEWWTGCGNANEDRRMADHVLREVWRSAALPDQRGPRALERIATGEFAPIEVMFSPDGEGARIQRDQAAGEAALILGDSLLGSGHRERARAMLARSVNLLEPGSCEWSIAATEFDRLAGP